MKTRKLLIGSSVGLLLVFVGSVSSVALSMTKDRGVSNAVKSAVSPSKSTIAIMLANKDSTTKDNEGRNKPDSIGRTVPITFNQKDDKESKESKEGKEGKENKGGKEERNTSKKDNTPTLTIPATITARANRYFHIRATTNCANIKWIIPDGLEQLDPSIPLKDSFLVVLIGDTGTYKVQCYGALDNQVSDIASCTVTIGSPTPPPGPTPPGPTPPSGLTATFQTAYNKDTDSDKATSLQFLQGVYEGLGQQASSWTDVKTNGDAQAKISGVIQAPGAGLNPNQLTNLRTAIATEFVSKFGSDATTPIVLATLATELGNIATSLKGVK